MNGNSYVPYDNKWSYPLQWIQESEFARWAYQRWIWRSALAKQGKPCRNTYQEELISNLQKADVTIRNKYKDRCEKVPAGRSFALKKAVDNIAAQMAGGVDSYNYQINDPYMVIDDDTEDLLSAKITSRTTFSCSPQCSQMILCGMGWQPAQLSTLHIEIKTKSCAYILRTFGLTPVIQLLELRDSVAIRR